jgi:hypothetical protein
MVMQYQWGHGVGHTYSDHFLKHHKSEIQTDIEMEDSPAQLVADIRGGPSPLGSAGVTNFHYLITLRHPDSVLLIS